MFNKTQADKALHQLKEELLIHFGHQTKVYLFGSVARGNFDSQSDIDILVIIDQKVTNSLEEKIFHLAYPIELEHNVVFGIIVYSKTFWYSPTASVIPLKKSIDKEGIPL